MANWDLLNEKYGLEKNDLGHDVEGSYAYCAKCGSEINLCKASEDKAQEVIECQLVVGEGKHDWEKNYQDKYNLLQQQVIMV